jgi:hypothetical protein
MIGTDRSVVGLQLLESEEQRRLLQAQLSQAGGERTALQTQLSDAEDERVALLTQLRQLDEGRWTLKNELRQSEEKLRLSQDKKLNQQATSNLPTPSSGGGGLRPPPTSRVRESFKFRASRCARNPSGRLESTAQCLNPPHSV